LSYFYAEVKRLKNILNAIENKNNLPLLCLIDEIFKGTNNKERLVGSLSYIRELSAQSAIGLISTHDLELANLEKEIKNLQNFHFREDIVDGKMHFDYLLRPGPSPTTNALKIMKLEGLPVNEH
jgi:DNA mismatch repair ATPase MutS